MATKARATRLRKSAADEIPAAPNQCLVCSKEEKLRLWTIDSGRRASAMYLCAEHEMPLELLMDAAAGKPPVRQKPLRDERQGPPPSIPRRRSMRPLEWTPPPEGEFYKH